MKYSNGPNALGELLRDAAVVMLDTTTFGLATKFAKSIYNPNDAPIPTVTASNLPFSPPRLQVIWFDNPKYNKWIY